MTSSELDPRAPKNRRALSLAVCDLRVAWDGGEIAVDPNELGWISTAGDYPIGAPFANRPSDLSGKPSYLYKCDNLEIALTFEELDRLCRRALRPSEVKKLIAKFGVFHDIYESFYWPDTFQKMQPRSKGPLLSQTIARLAALDERSVLEKATPSARASSKPSI